jgi:hypothetical protein
MKTIKCGRCKKTFEVPDDWSYKLCAICHEKSKASSQIRSMKRKLDREARNKIKELKLEGKTLSFSEWANLSKEKLNNPNPKWEEYLKYLAERKNREIVDEAERRTWQLRAENQKKYRLIREDLFPFKNERECYAFRLSRLNGSENTRHLDRCEDCSDWNYNFVNEMLEPLNDDKDDSEPIDPIDRWELEQWRKRGATIPDNSLDQFKPKQEPENPTPDKIKYESIQQPEPHSEPEEDPDPTTSRNDLSNIITAYDAKKQKQQTETDNEDQEAGD